MRTHAAVKVRTHVAATTVCATVGVHTLTCCTYMLLHITRAHFCLRIVAHLHACHTHAWLKVMKKVIVACACRLSPSPFSCFTRLPLLFLHGHFETNVTEALMVQVGFCPLDFSMIIAPEHWRQLSKCEETSSPDTSPNMTIQVSQRQFQIHR